jgi:hypothetical protein
MNVYYLAPEEVIKLGLPALRQDVRTVMGRSDPAPLERALRLNDHDSAEDSDSAEDKQQGQHGDFLHVLGFYAVRLALIGFLVFVFCLWLTS